MDTNDADDAGAVRYDLKFTEAQNFGNYISIRDVKHDALQPTWRAFQDNIERIRLMASVPQILSSAATRHLLLFSEAVFANLGKPVMDDIDLPHMDRCPASDGTGISGCWG
jgi:hypothetical protein